MSTLPNLINATNNAELLQEAASVYTVLSQIRSTATSPANSSITILPKPELLGIDQDVYDLINHALAVKQHLMFYGPPGTGKTTLAEHIARTLNNGEYILATGTSDWSSQDLIGGYQPTGGGSIRFTKGLILDNFDKPIIIDELNRVDIDKAIGPLFTVLSGQPTTLSYQIEPNSTNQNDLKRVHILPSPQSTLGSNQYAPSDKWRLLATINSVDKASLYQMSYALSRRFGWILIDVPKNLNQFIIDYLTQQTILTQPHQAGIQVALGKMWQAINNIRPVGPAPIIDIIKLCLAGDNSFDFLASPSPNQQDAYLNGFYAFLLPLLDGILQIESEKLSNEIIAALSITDQDQLDQIRKRVMYHSI